MLWASIILPITPPLLLAAAVSTGGRPKRWAGVFWRLSERTVGDVSLPVLAAAVSTGGSPRRWAVIFWRLPKRTLDDVSLPVSATPSQPSSGEKKGKSFPVLASARPIVASMPAYRVV